MGHCSRSQARRGAEGLSRHARRARCRSVQSLLRIAGLVWRVAGRRDRLFPGWWDRPVTEKASTVAESRRPPEVQSGVALLTVAVLVAPVTGVLRGRFVRETIRR